ncbi:MAG: hypothetical protein R3C15_01920 [Thermoleophilia bacterium]
MTDRLFDELARSLARPVPRRSALRLLGAALVAAAVPAVRTAGARAAAPGGDDPCPTCAGRPGTAPCCVRLSATTARIAIGQCYDLDTEQCCTGVVAYTRDGLPTAWICQKHEVCNPDGEAICACPGGSPRCSGECCPLGARCVEGACVCKDERDPCKGICCKKGEECVRGECKPYCRNETARGVSRVYDPETQCCTEHGIEQKYPIRIYERCRKTRVPRPGYEPTSNGCGPKGGPKVSDTFGKASFLEACNAHDICYGTCKSDRDACDKRFGKQLRRACRNAYGEGTKKRDACLETAKGYHDAVIALGSIAYADAQSEACQCCP